MSAYSWRQFQVWRIVLGAFLFIHFARILPYAGELFSGEGLFPAASFRQFGAPTIFRYFDSVIFCQFFLAGACALSLAFAAGCQRRICGFLLWVALTQLCSKNFFYYELEFGPIGWLLLASSLIPEPKGKAENFSMPAIIYWGGWLVLALSYTASGVAKLSSGAWLDGSAIQFVLSANSSRLPLTLVSTHWLHFPMMLVTWTILSLEILALPLVFFPRGRKLFWFAMVFAHTGIGVTTLLTELSIGMLIFYLFLWDRRFLPQPK